jgi:uncharacterized membrane protein YdfJ with MMPL/SSD domain
VRGLALAGIPFLAVMGLAVMGLAAAGAVLIALLIALTRMPAVLGFAGRKIIRFFNTPLRPGHHEQGAASMAAKVATVPGIISATPVIVSNDVAVIKAIPTIGPNHQATADVVNRLRDDRASIEASGGASTVLIGGQTASNIDTSSKLSSALPVFLIAVTGLAFLPLTFAFRTILVPIKSIIGFPLSASAALGFSFTAGVLLDAEERFMQTRDKEMAGSGPDRGR